MGVRAHELPLATEALAKSGKYDAVVALGTVIRGDAHFEYACRRRQQWPRKRCLVTKRRAGSLGVLTTESIEQAIERAGTKAGNKGAEAALTAL